MKSIYFLMVCFVFIGFATAGEYDEHKKVDKISDELKKKADYWSKRSEDLIVKIDAAIEKYHKLKDVAQAEVDGYKAEIDQAIQKEIQFRDIAQEACDKGEKKECDTADIHTARITDLEQKLDILNDVKTDNK